MYRPKLPDKIYFNTLDVGSGWVYSPSFDDNGGEKYIRKDALLEWAEKKIAKGMIDEWDKGYVQCLKDLIDKLNNF